MAAKRLVRRALWRAARFVMRARAKPYPIEGDTRCLVIAPHEDDATLGCGGLMLCKRLEGATVDVVYVTDGSASHPGHPTLDPRALALERRAEANAALGILGVERRRAHFLDAVDGTLDRLDEATAAGLVSRMADLFSGLGPDEIFLPCRRDGSSEHDAAFLLVRRALRRSGLHPRIYEYPVWSLWAPLRLARPLAASRRIWRVRFSGYEHVKDRALEAYRTQMTPMPPWAEPVLSAEFVSFFRSGEEFFFEMGERGEA
jgi:LmbE family N-acetylglucosaminyl deacetylase